MNNYLTIKQTVDYINRTDNTIRRVLIQKRNKINENESFEVIKRIGNLYYIYKPYLDKRYTKKHTVEHSQKNKDNSPSEELRELRETVKMYSVMLEEKDKQIALLTNQNQQLFSTLDQSQKLTALEKQLEILKIEK